MSQPYSVGLDESRGRPLLSVCAGAAHTLASTALLCRQQSLEEHRSIDSNSIAKKVYRQGSIESCTKARLSGADNENRLSKKLKSNMITLAGAVLAVEQDDVESLRAALQKKAIEPNARVRTGCYSAYCPSWSLLDIALFLGHTACAKVLLQNGATENPSIRCYEKRRDAVQTALSMTREKVNLYTNGPSSKDAEKQIKQLSAHEKLLDRMERVILSELPVFPPSNVVAEAISDTQVAIKFKPCLDSPATVIKYKVEWSVYADFATIQGECVETDMTRHQITVDELESGMVLFFRLSCGSMWDFSPPTNAALPAVQLTSWEEVDGQNEGRQPARLQLDQITEQIEKYRQSLVFQRVFPQSDQAVRKKKTGLKELFTASSKFAKNIQSGCYLATIIYTEGKVLCTVDDCLPVLEIDDGVTTLSKEDFQWLLKLSLCWDQLSVLVDDKQDKQTADTGQLSFRSKIISSAMFMCNALGIKDIGRLHQNTVIHDNVVFLVTIKYIDPSTPVQSLTLRWMSFDKLMRRRASCPSMETLTRETVRVMNFYESSQIALKRGLYLCYLKMHSTMSQIRIVVPDNLPSVLPFVSVRENPHVNREEWQWIKEIGEVASTRPTDAQSKLHSQISNAMQVLLHDLDIDPDLVTGHRLYRTELIQPSPDVSLILLMPKAEDVCSAPSATMEQPDFFEQRRGCTSLPISIFEMIHHCTYQPEFMAQYCRLSIFLEHFMMISQSLQRKSLLENDVLVYMNQFNALKKFQNELDEVWQCIRWISRIAVVSREKHARYAVPLGRLLAPPPLLEKEDVGYHSDQSSPRGYRAVPARPARIRAHSPNPAARKTSFQLLRPPPLPTIIKRPSITDMSGERLSAGERSRAVRPHSVVGSPQAETTRIDRLFARKLSMSFRASHVADSVPLPCQLGNSLRPPPSLHSLPTTSISVFPAYECGLAKGSSVKLAITSATTSQEVVQLVISQLAHSSPTATEDDAAQFCLAAVIGQRERRIKDDFPLLKLQNPWSKGRLFVRRRDCVLSAVQYGNEAVV